MRLRALPFTPCMNPLKDDVDVADVQVIHKPLRRAHALQGKKDGSWAA
jgi:hypothetical protein